MSQYGRYAVVALVVVALLSVGVSEAVERSQRFDAATCGSAEIDVSLVDDDYPALAEDVQVTDYANLSSTGRDVFDRARRQTDPVAVDPAFLMDSSLTETYHGEDNRFPVAALVRYEGAEYHVVPGVTNCPRIAGVPHHLNPPIVVLDRIHTVFSPLYGPVGAVVLIVLAYRRADAWLRFD